jgi:hypothetical protein
MGRDYDSRERESQGDNSMKCLQGLLTDNAPCDSVGSESYKRGGKNAGILHEVQKKGWDQESEGYHNEEQTTCYSRRLHKLRNQSLPNR